MPTRSHLDSSAWVLLAILTAALPAGATVVVSHYACDPIGRTEICGSGNVLPITDYLSGDNGTMFAGGAANATYLRGYLANGFGGNGSVISTYSDVYTLHGPGNAPITFTANLAVHGSAIRGSQGGSWIFGAGFMNSGGSHFPPPASVGRSSGADPDYSNFSKELGRELTLLPGDSIALDFQLILYAFHVGAVVDFYSTVALGFPDLPDGYYIRSATGFDGVGSQPGTGGNVPEPGTLLLSLLAGAAALRSIRSTRH